MQHRGITTTALLLGTILAAGGLRPAHAEELVVVIENTQELDGFFLTPFWIAAHNGSFDVWSSGQPASNFPGLEELAEEGDTGPIGIAFENSTGGLHTTVTADDVPVPVFSPGESRTYLWNNIDPLLHRYFSYASMVIPSNDLFVANSSPTMHTLFDSTGTFLGPVTIDIFGSSVVDAGTEVNDIAGGAAFSTLGGVSITEANPLDDLFDIDPMATFLSSVVGTPTANGATIGTAFTPQTQIARITIKKAPSPELRITVENLEPNGGLSMTPLWIAAHDGTFDVWSGGQPASNFPGLEELAEEGMTGPIDSAFLSSSAGAAGGTSRTIAADMVPVPVFSPGETATYDIVLDDAVAQRYFSYASMVIPSNDLFVANSIPTMYPLYDSQGDFVGPITIEITADQIVDAGTEVNNVAAGAAFSTLGGVGVDEGGLLTDLFSSDPAATYLNSLVGTPTPTGTITSVPVASDVVLRITIDVRPSEAFVRGDVDANGSIQITDAVQLLGGLFGTSTTSFTCERAADVNDSNIIDLSDAVILLAYLFQQGAPPPPPFPACDIDTTPDVLTCTNHAACP